MTNIAKKLETHRACNARLAKEGGKTRCCDCVPREDCEFNSPPNLKKIKPNKFPELLDKSINPDYKPWNSSCLEKENWEEEFEAKFPEYKGVGSPYPIFNDTPNRNHMVSFFSQALAKQREEMVKMAIEEVRNLGRDTEDEKDLIEIIIKALKEKG